MRLLGWHAGGNADIYREIAPPIAEAAPDAVMLVVTDPPDPLADIARQIAPQASKLAGNRGSGAVILRPRRPHVIVRLDGMFLTAGFWPD
jgi:L-lactate dehydrogenase